MKQPLVLSVILLSLFFLTTSCNEKEDKPTPDTITTPEELTQALTDIYSESEAPGFAISIVKNDVVIYQQAFGKADIQGDKNYTNQTTQPIGSISKTFVAAALVKAIEQGYFTLETNINDILPIDVKNPKQPGADIQVKHLVTHTSGLVDEDEWYLQAYHILPGEDLATAGAELMQNGFGINQRESIPLATFLADYYLENGDGYSMDNFAATAPGESWNYSNIATSLAAYLVEVASGQPFQEYVKTHILTPLEMTYTAYDHADLNSTNIAKLYWDEQTSLPLYWNDSYPDGSIQTSNEDLAKFLMDMMKGARGESTTLFSKEAYDLLFNPILENGVVPASVGDNQGIFWFLEDGMIHHDGSDPGTTCDLWFDQVGSAGYLLLTNMDASIDEHETAWYQLAGKVQNAISKYLETN